MSGARPGSRAPLTPVLPLRRDQPAQPERDEQRDIDGVHTYYVMTGGPNFLVHNCGDVDYGEVLDDGRRTGVVAIITLADLGTGSKPSRRIIPPGFAKNTPGHTRGHLLPKSLGGDGRVSANIVRTSSKVDNGAMAAFGDSIATHVGNGNTVLFQAAPRYLPGANVPYRVDINAFDDNGWSVSAQFLVG
ncbi:DNA/RNA non-specific endonuclease [Saccharothrix sp. NRRL B-16314]|uniref:DNA/RNA non-specific endonuclease n=1 Tax=Saccharothrix sp. NRRL B-16314 TaxID=1463825 RepID=UPI0005260F16|nr:DNA/RNA non-specific endonuclease [Saccharothrix sp. NRRL B-16314]